MRLACGSLLALVLLAPLAGCDCAGPAPGCTTSADCRGGQVCLDRRCQDPSDGGPRDGGPDAPPGDGGPCAPTERACGAACCGASAICGTDLECCARAELCGSVCCDTGEICEQAVCHRD